MATDVNGFMESLNAGVFNQQLASALSDVAGAVADYGKAGKVTIELNMKQLGEGQQVMIAHKLVSKCPTAKGSRSEDAVTETPMYVGRRGDMTLLPQNQEDLFDGENVTSFKKGAN